MKVGVLGGTFNPPHIGHLILGEEVRDKLNLEKIFFIPTNIPPHKEHNNIDAVHRLNMVKLSVKNNSYFEVLDWEINRGGVSYTIDTVKELKEKFRGDDFYLIVGSDLANTFSTWKNFQELKRIVKIVVAERQDFPLKERDDFIVIDIIQVKISSSRIRKMIQERKPIRYLVSDNVAHYIEKHKLYK
jgi:nicotinate-nucleotide adenylyltransferase